MTISSNIQREETRRCACYKRRICKSNYVNLYSYYDAEGNDYSFRERGGPAVDSSVEGDKEYSLQYGFMHNYVEDEVWVEFSYSKDWKAKESITVQIK